MPRSSTSSSNGWRRAVAAGGVALLLLVAVDSLLANARVLSRLEPLVEGHHLARMIVRLDKRLAGLSRAVPRARFLVLGNSRAALAIDPGHLIGLPARLVARPGLEAFQQRALAERVADGNPDAVVVTWSAFDTHRPVRLEPVAGRAVGSVTALWELLRATDASFVWRNREALLRSLLASLSNGYRYREVLGDAFAFSLRRFSDSRFLKGNEAPPIAGLDRIALWDAEPRTVPAPLRQEVRDLFPSTGDSVAVDQVDMISEIRSGEHVAVQTALLRGIVETLHDACISVVLVEAPLHPIARKLYDASLEEEFALFAEGLVHDFGVHLVPLGSLPPFSERDFFDLMHVSRSGRSKLTQAADAALRQTLSRDAARTPSASLRCGSGASTAQ